ncbi:hypothetical protein [Burkholderia gladioli]|uniref:Morphogenetic protein n=1 Tax=Burkholderia phage BgManors32 TaxID=2894335 RepID=A0AAE8YG97_9CAUD|nr:hypothetical protein [Burkholderia gladioli]YP_010668195.1 hypothetical protein PQC05_gp29 [Burkholderia phage BgManors32]UEW68593.1 hypothetical protein [Burkholderia phage BgManors32]
MKERPILFSAPMVRAILDGRKTQTRRVVKHQPPEDVAPITVARYHPTIIDRHGDEAPGDEVFGAYSEDGVWGCKCPYGEPGDRLWVRETWRGVVEINPPGKTTELGVARYVPDQEYCRRVEYQATHERDGEPWRPSIHMPRWASRITLEITGVRVERLQDISEQDAIAEGIERTSDGFSVDGGRHFHAARARDSFASLWDSLNEERGLGWEANPWVWVIEFQPFTDAGGGC